ncbi:2-amino-4-hydroxy-6-hydroxymethyldihydropteridine diphosphokinase [Candidimonas sp. SYP-B2681]|uniref:2-amino-4-hydroxy-6- hydroxymethyldihydropteridine diphosphokinase n=1 Tax=Candidimonas sp. SYP-B2681 TaxID=2497686 RepID=UPI000F87A1C1|nr:2-amino-4-hydroxy-6-hydroxymethyldihydropteridine diphosphokinase [Candidimonas sp. SYP-B2681]RTZ44714.1 2-amino-4-hydroxy-6-hydroxymethyldihydropteridine diphosphokinase [Candidimonas sp. SYP-B2681]
MALAYIGLGANLGDARATLLRAATDLAHVSGISQIELSPLYRSAPIESSGPDYINAVAALRTTLAAPQLLRILQQIEQQHGRVRPYHNAPRTLDLDLLWFDGQQIYEPDLIVPHPRMHERAFVLLPLSDLAPELVLAQGPIKDLLAGCADQALSKLPA